MFKVILYSDLMKPWLKIFIIFFFVSTFTINPISSNPLPRGYDIIHTRVKEGSFEIISFEDQKDQYYTQGVKLNYTIELWNPSTENVTFTYESDGYCAFVITFNDSILPYQITCGIYADQPSISVVSGITTINIAYERVYQNSYPEEEYFEVQNGYYNVELKLDPLQNTSSPFGVSYSSSIEFLNNNSVGFEPYLPDNWGIINESLPVAISTAITHAEFRFIHLNNSQKVKFGFTGESWNPHNETVHTSSPCYNQNTIHFGKTISFSNDIFLDNRLSLCRDAFSFNDIKPGVQQWRASTNSAILYNWNLTVLPDSEYYFEFTLFQNPLNIHTSKLIVTNGQFEIDYVTSPLWIYELTTTSATVSTSVETSLTDTTNSVYPETTQESRSTIVKSFKLNLFEPWTLLYSILLAGSIRQIRRKKTSYHRDYPIN